VPTTTEAFALQMTAGAIVWLEHIQKEVFEKMKQANADYTVEHLPAAVAAWLMVQKRRAEKSTPIFVGELMPSYLDSVQNMDAKQTIPLGGFFTNAVTERLTVTALRA